VLISVSQKEKKRTPKRQRGKPPKQDRIRNEKEGRKEKKSTSKGKPSVCRNVFEALPEPRRKIKERGRRKRFPKLQEREKRGERRMVWVANCLVTFKREERAPEDA